MKRRFVFDHPDELVPFGVAECVVSHPIFVFWVPIVLIFRAVRAGEETFKRYAGLSTAENLPFVRASGSGRVIDAGLPEAMTRVGLEPDWECEDALRIAHRSVDGSEVYFVSHPGDEPLATLYDLGPGDVSLATFPPFALFGPALGMTTVVPRMDPTRPGSASPVRLVRAARRTGATVMFGSPALLVRLVLYVPLQENLELLKLLRNMSRTSKIKVMASGTLALEVLVVPI